MPGMPQAPIGKFRRVVIDNVTGKDNGSQGSFISGIEDGLVATFGDVIEATMRKTS
jgi:hypothetical protein